MTNRQGRLERLSSFAGWPSSDGRFGDRLLAIVGVSSGFSQPIDSGHLLSHRQTVIGCFLGPVIGTPEIRAHVASLLRTARNGEFEVPIDAVFPFPQIAAAHARADERGRLGRVIVTV